MDERTVTGTVRAEEDSPLPIEMDFVIDADAPVSIVPGKVLRDLGVAATGEETVPLGGGQTGARKVGRVYFQLLGRGAYAKVAFGAEGEKPRLGRGTIEACGLVIDPVTRNVARPR